jgi:hypothetical protein
MVFVASASSLSAANTKITVWSDNFDDGNLDGWEIIGHDWISGTSYNLWTGNASVVNNQLWINGSGSLYTVAGYPSSVTHGKWSFDINFKNMVRVSFASNNNVTDYTLSSGSDFTLLLSDDSLQLTKRSDGNEQYLGLVSAAGISEYWQHVDITKDISNRILVYVNDTLQFNVTDDEVSKSLHFKLISNWVAGLDNVTVSDLEIVTPTTTTSIPISTTTTNSSPSWPLILVLIALTTLIYRKKLNKI